MSASRPRPARTHMRTPALDAWRRELAAGQRTPLTFDPLWKAACEEMSALEYGTAGLPTIADALQREARKIIVAATHGRVA